MWDSIENPLQALKNFLRESLCELLWQDSKQEETFIQIYTRINPGTYQNHQLIDFLAPNQNLNLDAYIKSTGFELLERLRIFW